MHPSVRHYAGWTNQLYKLVLSFFVFAFLAAISLLPIPSKAQGADTVFNMGTGGATGLYFKFGSQLSNLCGPAAGFKAVVTENGTEGNVDAALANQMPWFLGQVDYLTVRGLSEDLSSIKLLLPLFPEAVTVLTRNDVANKQGGFTVPILGKTVGGTDVQLADVTGLAGRKVGAFGGAKATAKLLQLQGGVGMDIVEFPGWDAAYAALSNKQVDAVISVQAKTDGNFRGLSDPAIKTLRFLPIPAEVVSRFKAYKPAQVKYPNMAPVASMEVMSGLFTKNYQKGPMVQRTAALLKCAGEAAENQADIPGTSPAWGFIKAKAEVPWERWNAPAAGKR